MTTIDDTPTFNLKAVIHETGLRPDTLRAWERRYGLPQPGRTEGGHRLYSERDINILKWLMARQEEGLSIGRAADLWHRLEAEGEDPLAEEEAEAEQPIPAVAVPPLAIGNAIQELRESWIAACLAYDEQTAEHIIAQAATLYPVETVCFELLQKGLVHMGEGWYKGEISVQQEHFASALALRWLEAMVVATPTPTRSQRILVGCPPDEEHTFSLLVITLLLRRQGWKALYLGANVPVARMESTIATTRPDLVVLSAQQLHTAATLLEMAWLLRREGVPLAFGGAIFNRVPELRSRIPGHFLGERLDLTPQVVDRLLKSPQQAPAVEVASEKYWQALSHYRQRQAEIEAEVWQALRDEDIPQSHLANANAQLAINIIAALQLGDVQFLGTNITWVEGLLVNHQFPLEQLYRYLDVYRQAAEDHLDEPGRPILAWLTELTERKSERE